MKLRRQWLYRGKESWIFEGEKIDEALAGGWADRPGVPAVVIADGPTENVVVEITRDALLAEADERKIDVDRRWGITKLQQALGRK